MVEEKPTLYKAHAPRCPRRRSGGTDCDCRWRAKFKSHDVDLQEWSGESLDPRKKRSATSALTMLWMADYRGFSPLGYEYSVSVDDLLERKRSVYTLHPSQRQAFIRHAAEHLQKAQTLLDALESYYWHDERARLALYRKPTSEMRTLVRLDRGKGFTFAEAKEIFQRELPRALRRRLADLVTDGLLVQDRADHWRTTSAGQSLQLVSRKRIKRETADRMVEEFVVRVRAVNASEAYAYRVRDAVLFGSYLGDEPMIGDLDIAVALVPRFDNEGRQEALEESIRETAPRARNMIMGFTWPRRQVQSVLRGRGRIDLRDLSELEAVIAENEKKRNYLRTRTICGGWRQPPRQF